MTAWAEIAIGTIGLLVFWASALYLVTTLFGAGHGEALGG